MANRLKQHPMVEALLSKRNVINAVILRDMRTRFFNHGLGFALVPIWPLAHMGLIILIHSTLGQKPPFGQSTALFYATGIVPTLTFIYISRFMGYSLMTNRPMMAFPVVKAIDVMAGRACLEIISANITLALILLILWIAGADPWPVDLERAVLAYLCVIFLGYGVGTLVGVLGLFLPFLVTLWQLLSICFYIASGTLFVASNLPDSASRALSYNPLTICVEWMRTAFYESYSDKLVDPFYVISCGTIALILGLGIEKLFRGRLLEG